MTWEPKPTASASAAPAPAIDPAPTVAPVRRRSSRLLDVALAGAAVLAIAGLAFAVGRTTAPTPPAAAFERGGSAPGGAITRPSGSFDPGAGPRGGLFADGLSLDGTVAAIDGNSMTLTLDGGRVMTLELDESTTYHAATDASASDVAVGDDVSVKVGGGAGFGGPDASGDPQLSASDVTVTR
jgi:hypothetical protein